MRSYLLFKMLLTTFGYDILLISHDINPFNDEDNFCDL